MENLKLKKLKDIILNSVQVIDKRNDESIIFGFVVNTEIDNEENLLKLHLDTGYEVNIHIHREPLKHKN